MSTGRGTRTGLAALVLFTVAAGDFWRNLLSWYGWMALCVVLLVLVLVELMRVRPSLRRLPVPLLVFLTLATVSVFWSFYPGATLAGLAATWLTTTAGAFLALCLAWDELVAALSVALRWVLGLSLVFEVAVGLFVRRPVLPVFPPFDPDAGKIPDAFAWSRAELFTGGPIQGIVGNDNLLAMVALLALITLGVQTAAGTIRRSRGWLWMAVALLVLALTRSAAVLLAAVVVAGVLGLALLARRLPPPRRAAVSWGAAGAVTAVVVAGFLFAGPLLDFLRRSVDLTHRLDIWAIVTGLAVQRPLAGWGWVSHWAPWVEPFDDLIVINGVTYLQAHNAWLDVFLQLGWIGFFAFAALVGTVLVRSWWLATDSPQVEPGRTEPFSATTLLPLLGFTALIVQSLAESRMLVELGWTLLVVLAIHTKRAQLPVARPTAERAAGAQR